MSIDNHRELAHPDKLKLVTRHSSFVTRHSSFVIVAVAYLLCLVHGVWWICSTPLWEGFDEAYHYGYIQTLAETGKLPALGATYLSKEVTWSRANAPIGTSVGDSANGAQSAYASYWNADPQIRMQKQRALRSIPAEYRSIPAAEDDSAQNYEAQHAPLFYFLGAMVYRASSTSDLLTRVFLLRLLSLLFGSLTVFFAFAAARHVFESPAETARIPLLVSLLPMFQYTIARISNDGLAVLLFCALILSALRYFRTSTSTKQAVWIGVVLGLGLLTKAYFLAAIPALILVFLFARSSAEGTSAARSLGHMLIVFLLASAISGWWYLRNYTFYGNLAGLQDLPSSSVGLFEGLRQIPRVPWLKSIHWFVREHIWTGNSSALSLPRLAYVAGYLIILLSILGILRDLLAAARLRKQFVRPLTIIATFYVFFLMGILYHMLHTFILFKGPGGTRGWYLYALIVAEVILLVRGLESLIAPLSQRIARVILVTYFLVLNLLGCFWGTIPSYSGFDLPNLSWGSLAQLYSPQNCLVILDRLIVDKPTFVTPSLLGGILLTYIAFLFITAICSLTIGIDATDRATRRS